MFAIRDFVVLFRNSLPKYNALIVDLKGYFLNLAASLLAGMSPNFLSAAMS